MLPQMPRPEPMESRRSSLSTRLPKLPRQKIARGRYIVRQGHEGPDCALLVDGLAQRNKIVARGARQILGLCVPGDLVDLPLIFLDRIDHNVQAVTDCEVIHLRRDMLKSAAVDQPVTACELWTRSLVDTSIAREWQANIGRRNAAMRMAHLICELRHRLIDGEPADGESFELPLTQADLADVLGLTPVHINRVLRELEDRRLLERDKRLVTVPDWEALRRAADFNPAYLHGDVVHMRMPAWIAHMINADLQP